MDALSPAAGARPLREAWPVFLREMTTTVDGGELLFHVLTLQNNKAGGNRAGRPTEVSSHFKTTTVGTCVNSTWNVAGLWRAGWQPPCREEGQAGRRKVLNAASGPEAEAGGERGPGDTQSLSPVGQACVGKAQEPGLLC